LNKHTFKTLKQNVVKPNRLINKLPYYFSKNW